MKSTTKSLKINEITHNKLKIYCAKFSLKMNEWVDKLILKEIEKYKGKL